MKDPPWRLVQKRVVFYHDHTGHLLTVNLKWLKYGLRKQRMRPRLGNLLRPTLPVFATSQNRAYDPYAELKSAILAMKPAADPAKPWTLRLQMAVEVDALRARILYASQPHQPVCFKPLQSGDIPIGRGKQRLNHAALEKHRSRS